MTPQEIARLFREIDYYYPRSQPADPEGKFKAWSKILAKHEAATIFKNLLTHVERSSFPPNLSELLLLPEKPQTIPDANATKKRFQEMERERAGALPPDKGKEIMTLMQRNLSLERGADD